MIKLKIPFNHKGHLLEDGATVLLPSELEDKMVKAGSAEYIRQENNSDEKPDDSDQEVKIADNVSFDSVNYEQSPEQSDASDQNVKVSNDAGAVKLEDNKVEEPTPTKKGGKK